MLFTLQSSCTPVSVWLCLYHDVHNLDCSSNSFGCFVLTLAYGITGTCIIKIFTVTAIYCPFLASASSTEAQKLSCYVCDSASNPSCGDPFSAANSDISELCMANDAGGTTEDIIDEGFSCMKTVTDSGWFVTLDLPFHVPYCDQMEKKTTD